MKSLLQEYIKTILLAEYHVIGSPKSSNGYQIFVYKDKLFILERENTIPRAAQDHFDYNELLDIQNDIDNEEMHTDWLMARVDGKNKILYPISMVGFSHNPETSLMIKKVCNQLGLQVAKTFHYTGEDDDDVEVSYDKSSMRGEIPSMGYHGTSSNSLFKPGGIMRVGLRPGGQVGKSNFRNIGVVHDEVISLDFNKETVKLYASMSTEQQGGFKVILGVKIPDQKNVVPDFDIDIHTGKTTYPHMGRQNRGRRDPRVGRGPLKTSVDVGRIGYAGRIPPSFITRFWYFSENNKSWEEASLEEMRNMWEMAQDFGDEYYEMSREEFEEDDQAAE